MNTWKATSLAGEVEFRSSDFDPYALEAKLGLPIAVVDVTDGDREVATILPAEDIESAYRLDIHWAETSDWEHASRPAGSYFSQLAAEQHSVRSEFHPAYHGPEDPRIAERATVVKLERIAADAKLRAANEVASGHERDAAYYFGFAEGLKRAVATVEGRDHSPS